MNKKEFISAIAKKSGEKPELVLSVVESSIAIITELLEKKEKLSIVGFGRLYPILQTPRQVRNPQTGEPVMFTERTSVRFKPGKYLLNDLNK